VDPLDQTVLHWFQARHTSWLNAVMINLTDLGHRYVVTVVALVAVVFFLAQRRFRTALVMLLAALVAWGLIEGIKRAVQRPRPAGVERVPPSLLTRALALERQRLHPGEGLPEVSHAERTWSFPSGHALASAAAYGTLALVTARRLRRRWARRLVVGGTALLVLAIGITRLYLGAHYLTDVLAGWTLGVLCALALGWLDARWAAARAAPAVPEAGGP
jgi:undecaprenyl-diphosphatase